MLILEFKNQILVLKALSNGLKVEKVGHPNLQTAVKGC